jgi:hypothetical protein
MDITLTDNAPCQIPILGHRHRHRQHRRQRQRQ